MSRPTAVTGTVDLARPAARQPRRGHDGRAPGADATATTRRSALAFTGRVEPPVEPRHAARAAGGAPAAVDVGADGALPRARAQAASAGAQPLRARGDGAGAAALDGRRLDHAAVGGARRRDRGGQRARRLRPLRRGGAERVDPAARRPGCSTARASSSSPSRYDVLATTPGLIVLGVLFVLDFVGDKVPAIDRLLHAVGSVVHPASGAIVFAGADRGADRHPVDRAVRARRHRGRLAARDARDDPAGVDHADRRGGQPGAVARRGHGLGGAQRARRARAARRASWSLLVVAVVAVLWWRRVARARRGADYADAAAPPAPHRCSRSLAAPAQAPERPSVVVMMTDDQTYADMAAMPRTRRLIGDGGRALHALLRLLSAVLPVARDVPDRPVQPQQRGADEHAAEGRLRGARRRAHAAGVAERGGLPDLAHRQVPQRLRAAAASPTCRRAGPTGTAPSTRARTRCTATRSSRTASVRPLRQLRRRGPGALPDRRPARQGGRRRSRARAPGTPLFLSLMFVAPHGESVDPGSTTAAVRAPRAARTSGTTARLRLPRVDRAASATSATSRPTCASCTARAARPRRASAPTSARAASRCSPSTRRSRPWSGALARTGRLDSTRTSSSPPTTASSRASTGSTRASTWPTTRPRTCRC